MPFWKKGLICEKILFGFGSQITRGEGFIKKHPARPRNSRSLLNNLWDFVENILLKTLTIKQVNREIN